MLYRRAEFGHRSAEMRCFRQPLHHLRTMAGNFGAEDDEGWSQRDCRWPEGRSLWTESPYGPAQMHSNAQGSVHPDRELKIVDLW